MAHSCRSGTPFLALSIPTLNYLDNLFHHGDEKDIRSFQTKLIAATILANIRPSSQISYLGLFLFVNFLALFFFFFFYDYQPRPHWHLHDRSTTQTAYFSATAYCSVFNVC